MAVAWDANIAGRGDMAKIYAELLGRKVEPDNTSSAGIAEQKDTQPKPAKP